MDRKHVSYFDPIRLTASFCVIFMHTASGLLRAGVNAQWEVLNVCVSFSFTAVPLFLMMSGYLLLSGERTMDIRVLFTKRLPRLVVPLIFWTATALLEVQLIGHTFTPLAYLKAFLPSFSDYPLVHLWYMHLLLTLYIISPFLRACVASLDRSGHRYLLILIAVVTAQAMLATLLPSALRGSVSLGAFEYLKIFGGNLCSFILGFYLGSTQNKIPNWLLWSGAAVLLAVISLGTRTLTLRTGAYAQDFQTQSVGFEVALAACIFLLWKNFTRPLPRFLAPTVSLTLPVYLMHGLLLAAFEYYGFFPHDFLGTVRKSVLIFLICYLCMKTAASVKPFCYLITGMKYEDACRTCNWQYTFRALGRDLSARRTTPKGEQ